MVGWVGWWGESKAAEQRADAVSGGLGVGGRWVRGGGGEVGEGGGRGAGGKAGDGNAGWGGIRGWR